METKPVSEMQERRGWFKRLGAWKKAGVVLAAFVVVVVILALLGAMFSAPREAAREAAGMASMRGLPVHFAPGAEAKMAAPAAPAAPGSLEADEAARTAPAEVAQSSVAAPLPSLETWHRQLILTATIALEVRDVRAAYDRIQMVAAAEGALVTAASLEAGSGSGEENDKADYGRATVVVRVPQSRFHTLRQRLLGLAPDLEGKVLRDDVTSQDVTEEYVDLQSRLRNWRAQEAQLLEIMRKAHRIPDILSVRNRLSEVQQEIERLSGRLRFLQNRVDLSTITVEVYQKGKAPAPPTIASTWKDAGKGIAAATLQSVKNVVYMLGLLVVGLVYVLPFAVIIALIWTGVRAARKRAPSRSAPGAT